MLNNRVAFVLRTPNGFYDPIKGVVGLKDVKYYQSINAILKVAQKACKAVKTVIGVYSVLLDEKGKFVKLIHCEAMSDVEFPIMSKEDIEVIETQLKQILRL